MRHPFFSIIIPTYNREKFLYKTIKSFLDQTFTNFEILVIDDGGNDNSKQVIASFNDDRIKYYWKENGERGAARNYGANKAIGTYFNFFDSDDIAYPMHLQTAYDLLNNTQAALLFLGYEFVDQQGKSLSTINNFKGDVANDIVNRNKRNLNSVLILNTAFNAIKFEENRLLAASEDTLLLCRLVARHTPIYKNIITSAMVEHDNRSMATASEMQLLNRRRLLLDGLKADEVFMKKYSSNIDNIHAEMSYLLCLSCLSAKDNTKAIKYFKEYQKGKLASFFSYRTMVVFKKCFLNFFKK